MVFISNVEEINFADIQAARLDSLNAMPVDETLTADSKGAVFDHLQPHLISAEQLLADTLKLSSSG
jgi:hypothetical protein